MFAPFDFIKRTTSMPQTPEASQAIPESANKGLEGIVACTSEISTIHDVTLLHRGYTIEDLAAHCGFEKVIAPVAGKTIAWNFLNMIRGKEPTVEEEKLFDSALVLHADHELNASAFTARVVASTTSDYYSYITAAIGSLKGPLHGGANEQ